MNHQIGSASGGNGEQPRRNLPNGIGHINIRPPPRACPRCTSSITKFTYFNNKSLDQPRYLCKFCNRTWTQGGTLRNIPFGGSNRRNRRPMGSSLASARGIPSSSQQPPIAQAPLTFLGFPMPPVAPIPMGSTLASARDIPSTSHQPPAAFAPPTFSGFPVPLVAPIPVGYTLASARDIPSTSQQPPVAFAPPTFSGFPVPPVAPFPMGASLASARGIPSLAPTTFSGPRQLPFAAFPGNGNNMVFTVGNNHAGIFFPWLARSGQQPLPAPPAIPMGSSLASARGIPPLAPPTSSGFPTPPASAFPGNGNNMVFRGMNYNAGQQPYGLSNLPFMPSNNNVLYIRPNNAQGQLFRSVNHQAQVEIDIGGSSSAGGGLNLGVQPYAPPPPTPEPSVGDDFNNEYNIQ